jgi:UTP-glucose-1-phosphate uridylyltransferase
MSAAPDFLIIPAAGLGTRMRSVDPLVPKELLAINGKPAIQSTVAEGFSVGIKKIVIVINRNKENIRRYFEDPLYGETIYPQAADEMTLFRAGCEILFRYQQQPLGEADAIGLCRDAVGNSSLAVIYPDNLYAPQPGALLHLLPHFVKTGKEIIGLTEVTQKNQAGISNAGRVDLQPLSGDLYNISRLLSKGPGPFASCFAGELRACGIMLSEGSHLFDCIEQARATVQHGEFTDMPVRTLIMQHHGLLGCRLPGPVFDIGNPLGYEQCQQYMTKTIDTGP